MKYIVCVAYGDSAVLQVHMDCMMRLRVDHSAEVLEIRESCHIDIARSRLATVALEGDVDVVVFIDADVQFEPADVASLATVAATTRGIVAAPYSMRGMGAAMVGGVDSPDGYVIYEGGGLYPARSFVGMGFTAIHREVFERMHEDSAYDVRRTTAGQCRPYFQKLVVDGLWMHEDVSFCHTARRLGCAVDVDTRFRVTHWGLHGFRLEDCAARPENARQIRLKR